MKYKSFSHKFDICAVLLFLGSQISMAQVVSNVSILAKANNVMVIPGKVTLVSPRNDSIVKIPEFADGHHTIDEMHTILIWNKGDQSVKKYNLVAAGNLNMTNIFIDTVMTDTSLSFWPLLGRQIVYWKVRAMSDSQWGDYSDKWKFIFDVAVSVKNILPTSNSYQLLRNQNSLLYSVPVRGDISLKVYDMRGKMVLAKHTTQESGRYQLPMSDLTKGIYCADYRFGDRVIRNKFVR